MARRPLIVWGTCWLDETTAVLSDALRWSGRAVHALEAEIVQVVFDARHDRQDGERAQVAATTGAHILVHDIEAYPNKNLGVALIAAKADALGADVVAVVDADWVFHDYKQFVQGLLAPILTGRVAGVLPDISRWAGRANRLVGEPAMRLLQPGMDAVVRTPMPGAVAATPEALCGVTAAPGYHYDWGGEWDIASGFWSSVPIMCPELGMVNVRHRNTASKAGDAYQIWRAALNREGTAELALVDEDIVTAAAKQLGAQAILERLQGSATEQLRAFAAKPPVADAIAATVTQLVPMVLAPLALLVDGTDTRFMSFPEKDTLEPYSRPALGPLSILAAHAAGSALSAGGPGRHDLVPESGGPLGTWDPEKAAAARSLVEENRWI